MSLSVVAVDDHRTFAELMRLGLDAQPDIHCVAVAHTAAEARDVARRVNYDAALVDLGLPDGDGADLVGELRRTHPASRIVVLTAHPRSDTARRALAAGANIVLPKQGRLDAVLRALREPAPDAAEPVADGGLSRRQLDVLCLLADGLDVRGIAERLGLSVHTVRDHVKAILAQLGAHTQLEAVVVAVRRGILIWEPR